MKKFIVFAVVLALLVPRPLCGWDRIFPGQASFNLDAMWDRLVVGKNLNGLRHATMTVAAITGGMKFTARGRGSTSPSRVRCSVAPR